MRPVGKRGGPAPGPTPPLCGMGGKGGAVMRPVGRNGAVPGATPLLRGEGGKGDVVDDLALETSR
jgi:hypothetical protein